MKTLKKSVLLLGMCCAIATGMAQDIQQRLKTNFNTFKNHPALKNGIASIHVLDMETGKTIFEHNSQIGLPTASTLKVITAITALDLLGADNRYSTDLLYSGHVDALGVLHGDIIIRGTGDPTLGSNRYEQTKEEVIIERWIKAITKAGIKSIKGRIIGDDRLYEGHDIPGGWIWTDMGNYYGAGISALNWRENKVGVQFAPKGLEEPTPIQSWTGDLSYLNIINKVTTAKAGTGDNVYAYTAPYSEKITLKGTHGIDLKKTIEIAIPDPAYDLAYQFTKALEKRAIKVDQNPTTGQRLLERGEDIADQTKVLDKYLSPTIAEIVYWFNQKSINLYGEALLKSIAFKQNNKTSTTDGASVVKKYWFQTLKINVSELDIIDGSGLSPQNNVTTAAMTKIMQYAKNRPWYTAFYDSLPLYNQMKMKSGTINGTLGYTGYHEAKNGKKYTFTLLVYNYASGASTMRQNMFELLNTLK